MKKLLIKFLPLAVVSLLAIGFAVYFLIFVYQKIYEYAKDFLVYQGTSLITSFKKWFEERQSDVNFILTTKELRNFLFSFDEKTKNSNKIFLNKIIGQIAKSHNYKNFWVFNQSGEQLFCLDSSFELPKTLICGEKIQNIFFRPGLGDNRYFIELTMNNKSKVTILLIVNKIFKDYDTTKYFCFISAFNLDEVFSDFIPTIWSKFELVEYTFSCIYKKNTYILWNYPKLLDTILILPKENNFTFAVSNAGRPLFFEAISFLNNEKTIGYGGKFPQANLFYGIKILKSKINSQFYVLAFIIGMAWIFLVIAIVLGAKSIKDNERRKRLLIERDYLHQLYKATHKYELFTKNANDMVIVCDENNNILEINNKTLEILRYSELELKTKSMFELVYSEDQEKLMDFDPLKEKNLEIRFLDANGNLIFCSLSMSIIEVEDKRYKFYIIKDVTKLVHRIEKSTRINRLLIVSRMINEIILKRFELGEIFERTCEISVMVGGFHFAVF